MYSQYSLLLRSFILTVSIYLCSCTGNTNTSENKDVFTEFKAGDICTVNEGDGNFGIVKILVMEKEIVHLKIYKNKYSKRPDSVELKTLSIGSMYDTDGFGVGHTPLDKKSFMQWQPVIAGYESIAENELEGYKIWQDQ